MAIRNAIDDKLAGPLIIHNPLWILTTTTDATAAALPSTIAIVSRDIVPLAIGRIAVGISLPVVLGWSTLRTLTLALWAPAAPYEARSVVGLSHVLCSSGCR